MKNPITPTSRERRMRSEDFIVSKTDPKGRITYANRIFMEISGYEERQLLGVQHNIIRHPDMPRAVFKLMWDTLQAGREFFGYVKNMAVDGSFYWTFANVTPVLSERRDLLGYYSVRRKPDDAAVRVVAGLYAEMLAAERSAGTREAIDRSRKLLDQRLSGTGNGYEQFVLAL